MLSPPLAISALLGGRKRATTVANLSAPSGDFESNRKKTFDRIVATGATKVPASDRSAQFMQLSFGELTPLWRPWRTECASDRSSIGDNRIKPPKGRQLAGQCRRDVSLHTDLQAQAAKRVMSFTGHGRSSDIERVTQRAHADSRSDIVSRSIESLNTVFVDFGLLGKRTSTRQTGARQD